MHVDLNLLIHRLEAAQTGQNHAFCLDSGGAALPLSGGHALYYGPGHPLNQALGQSGNIDPAELTAAEAMLGQGGHPVLLELSPALEAEAWALLAHRRYRVHQFQHLLARDMNVLPEAFGIDVHRASPGEIPITLQTVAASFEERDDWPQVIAPFPAPARDWSSLWIATVDGEPVGGGTLSVLDGVALLSGDGVLPRFRGRGIQKALIAARLRAAAECGADIACASTLPSTASQCAYEACGFRVRYPKVEMMKPAKA